METKIDLDNIVAPSSRGMKCLKKFMSGEPLTRRESMLANCCSCRGYYVEGLKDCEMPTCPIYPFMPYRKTLK